MIDEEKTFKMFGYTSDKLKPQSHKKIVVICDDCEKERILDFRKYRDFCGSCSHIGIKHSKETKQKLREINIGRKHSKKAKQKMSILHTGKHPSEETRQKMSESSLGDKNSNWNPNLIDKDRQDRRATIENKEWREGVFERDDYTCIKCEDNTGGNLIGHHIESYADNPELRYEIFNGATLCIICHRYFHHLYGYGHNTRKQLKEFMGDNK